MFAKGRSNEQAFIEDYSQVLLRAIYEIPKYLKEHEKETEKRFSEIAREEAQGDKEVERSIFNSLNYFNDYSEMYGSFYESFYLSIYSFYEKTLKNIAKKNGITIVNDKKLSYAGQYIKSIRQHLGIANFSVETETNICDINGKHRDTRNNLAHEGSEAAGNITVELVSELLEKVSKVLCEINKTVENK